MTTHTSATAHEETPHANQTTRTNTIFNALKQRAQAVLNDTSIDAQTRAIIRCGLQANAPWIAELVCRAGARETAVDTFEFSETTDRNEHSSVQDASVEHASGKQVSNRHSNGDGSSEHDSNDGSSEEKLARLVEIICGAGEEPAAALLVLIGTFEDSAYPGVLANTAKHIAFARCGELNLYGMVDAQIASIERELWST